MPIVQTITEPEFLSSRSLCTQTIHCLASSTRSPGMNAIARAADHRAVQLSRPQFISGRDRAAGGHLGINAAIGMVEILHQRTRDFQVADAGVRVDVGGGTALDPLDHLEPYARPDGDLAADEAKLGPSRPTLDVEVGAEAQRVHRHPEDRL